MNITEAKKLAKEHAEWTGEFVKKIYYEAFLHGFKHGGDSKRNDRPKNSK